MTLHVEAPFWIPNKKPFHLATGIHAGSPGNSNPWKYFLKGSILPKEKIFYIYIYTCIYIIIYVSYIYIYLEPKWPLFLLEKASF